jgi:DNA-binding CsgD family transcriptional regulator/tetratricopeptide (TPR) repeat protein
VAPVLVGRVSECAELHRAYERVTGGKSVTALVAGEAGIGKSRLVDAVVTTLPGDPLVLTGGCLEAGSDTAPYVPFVAALRDLVGQLGGERVEALMPLDGCLLAQWLPGLGAVGTVVEQGRTRLLEELRTLLERVAAQRPVVLVIEDLHWADASSRELFVYLARNLASHPVMLVGTVRSGELPLGGPGRMLLAELRRRAEVVWVDVQPLSRTDVAELVEAITDARPAAAAASRIHQRSGGNPLFVEALSRSEDISGNLHALLLDRVGALPSGLRRLMSIAAVAGDGATEHLMRVVSGLGEDDLREALVELVRRQELVVRADGYAIRHALIREAIYRSLLDSDRRQLHLRCADALSGEVDGNAALAAHCFAAGDLDRALPAAWTAAQDAARQCAYDEQLYLLEQVLAGWSRAALAGVDRVTVLEQAASACHLAGRSDSGVAHCTAALAELDPVAEPVRVARLLSLRGRMRARIGASGHVDLTDAVALVPPEMTQPEAVRTRGHALATLAFLDGSLDRSQATRHATEALRIADSMRDHGLRASALLVLARVCGGDGDIEAARKLYADGRDAAEASGDQHTYLTLLQWEAASLLSTGYLVEAAELALTGQLAAERFGLVRSRGSMLAANRALALLQLGRWDEAAEVATDALAEEPPPFYEAALRMITTSIAVDRGEERQADDGVRWLEDYVARNADATEVVFTINTLIVNGALNRGDLDHADRVLAVATAHLSDPDTINDDASVLVLTGVRVQLARKAANPRDRHTAEAVAGRLAELQTLSGRIRGDGPALIAFRLTVAALAGSATLPDWDRAVSAWRTAGCMPELALALVAAAETALFNSNRPGAQLRLREAQALARQLRAEPLLRKIDRLAVRARLPATTPEPAENTFGLTPRETDVLRVLATGKSNAEIAAELYVSTNTVATHVSHILTKLRLSTRTEAIALTHRAGILD